MYTPSNIHMVSLTFVLFWLNFGYVLLFTSSFRSAFILIYPKTSDIRRASEGNKIVDHSDVVGAAPVGAVQLHLHSRLNTWIQWIGQIQLQYKTRKKKLWFGAAYVRCLTVPHIPKVITLSQWQSCDCPYATDVSLDEMGKRPNNNKALTVCTILEMLGI